MKLIKATPLIYLFAAGACAAFLVLQAHEVTAAGFLLEWALFFGPALLFAFAYPRYVFDSGAGRGRRIWNVALNGLSLSAVLIAFNHRPTYLYPPFPLAFFDSVSFLIITLLIFTTSAVCLLLKKLSDLASAVVVLEWIVVLAVSASLLPAQWGYRSWGWVDVLCSLSLPLLAFAAGSLRYRRALAHSAALLAAAMFVPRLYRAEFTPWGRMISNAWIAFNGSTMFLGDERLSAVITILTVALLVFAAAVAVCRLLPQRWVLRESPVSERTWPAIAVMALFIGVWFRLSVLPYRIPGEIYYTEMPIIQILHVEKHGLQFHETCVSVYQLQKMVRITHDDRRLLNYRFQEVGAETYDAPATLMQRVNELAHSSTLPRSLHDARNDPVRSWNADYWYAWVHRNGFTSYYSTEKGDTPPPPDFVMLFHNLEALQPRLGWEEKLRDVCLGFCYDPCAAMGWRMSADRYTEIPGHFVCH